MKRSLILWLALVHAGPALAVDEAAVGIKVHRQSGVNFVTGGMGDEAQAFAEISARYPVHVRFTVGGAPVAEKGVHIRVLDVKGDALVEADAGGPLFYVNPPSGRWTFEATWNGQTLAQTKDLTGRRYLEVSFDFKSN